MLLRYTPVDQQKKYSKPFFNIKDWKGEIIDLILSWMSVLLQSGEFLWDNMASLQQQGFSVEPSKGIVEAGHKRTITVTWTPYSGYKVRKRWFFFFITVIELEKHPLQEKVHREMFA